MVVGEEFGHHAGEGLVVAGEVGVDGVVGVDCLGLFGGGDQGDGGGRVG